MESNNIGAIARVGLTAKGIVYSLMGIVAMMAAFKLNGKSAKDAGTTGVFSFLEDQSGGKILLAALALGLVCYVIWRMIQAFRPSNQEDGKMTKRARYFFSGLAYSALTYQVVKMLFSNKEGGGQRNKEVASQVLSADSGQILLGILAAVILAIGIYQIYYGLSEKYRKHVSSAGVHSDKLLLAGKIGYVARGSVWLLVAYLFFRAALDSNSSKAGSTPEAFGYLRQTEYGTLLMAAMALGLFCYGVFCFVRAKYEEFN